MLNKYIDDIELIIKELSFYEKKGLDTSSLKLFLKNLKNFNKIQSFDLDNSSSNISFNEKLEIIKSFLEDKKAFPRISDVIEFANNKLDLGFKDQKESREITIRRIIKRIDETPELKEKIKHAVFEILNQHNKSSNKKVTKKDIDSIESFSKWAEILRNI